MQNIFEKYFEQLTAEITLTLRRSLSYPDGENGVGNWLPFFSEKFFTKVEEKYILAEASGVVEGWNNGMMEKAKNRGRRLGDQRASIRGWRLTEPSATP